MPELPEVEVLVRYLAPLLERRRIRAVEVRRAKVIRPDAVEGFAAELTGARFGGLSRRGKHLLFRLRRGRQDLVLRGHLGMTGRMYLQLATAPLPKHAAVVFDLGRTRFVFEDVRYFGRLTLDGCGLERLGPEPLGRDFTPSGLAAALRRSRQPIKVRLLDQTVVAGVGNIYASEALFRARLAPGRAAGGLSAGEVRRLWRAVRAVLREAIRWGSTVPLNWSGTGKRDGLFYYGKAPDAPDYYAERLRVYGREGKPCARCRTPLHRAVQAGRATFFCPRCQAA